METLGHIKVGEVTKGLPSQTNKIQVVTTGKNGNDNFIPYKEYEKGVDSIKVQLPFVYHLKENFKVVNVSFILLNNKYKYRAEAVGNHVYLFPYQPNFDNVLVDLPVIKLGTIKKFQESLQMELRAIGYVNLISEDKIFDFKTMSKFSIFEIQKFLKRISSLPAKVLAGLELDLVYKGKVVEYGKIKEVKYLTFGEVTNTQIIEASRKEISTAELKAIKALEDMRITEQKEQKENAITPEEAATFFGEEIKLKVDTKALEEYGFTNSTAENLIEQVEEIEEKREAVKEKVEKENKMIEENENILNILIEKDIPKALAKALILKHNDKTIEVCEQFDYNIPNLIGTLN